MPKRHHNKNAKSPNNKNGIPKQRTKNKIRCKVCHDMKIGTRFATVTMDGKRHSNPICKKCQCELNMESTLYLYAFKICFHIQHYADALTQITFDLGPDDVIKAYNEQNGKSFSSNRTMTYILSDFNVMNIFYPNNLVIRTINEILGYVPDNIYLSCVTDPITTRCPINNPSDTKKSILESMYYMYEQRHHIFLTWETQKQYFQKTYRVPPVEISESTCTTMMLFSSDRLDMEPSDFDLLDVIY